MRTFSKLFLIMAVALVTVTANAQLKIGHINSQELLAAMPETDSAQKKLEKKQVEHNQRMVDIENEFNEKLKIYQDKLADKENPMSVLEQQDREDELGKIQERANKYEQSMQQDLQMLRMQLFQPIQEKAIKAVNEVAEEKGFTYILDTGAGAVVYSSPDSEDILPLVKAKLGVK
jgi:outer membrane protein